MAKILDIHDKKLSSEGFNSFVSTKEKIDVPYTVIQNRAQMVDVSKTLAPMMGVNRVMTKDLIKIADEVGPNGEMVYGVSGDTYNQIRFVGDWSYLVTSSGTRARVNTATDSNSYVEITFYGTGINLISLTQTGGIRQFDAYVDDVFSKTISYIGSGILQNRNYAPQTLYPIAKGLAVDLHTIKLKARSDDGFLFVYGFEILNESADIVINSGQAYAEGNKLTLQNQFIGNYKEGVVGTNGARVIKYLDNGGNIQSSITEVGSPLYLTNSNHSNEDIKRIYNFREFTAGRNDDFSTSNDTIRGYTLDDNTTTLFGSPSIYANTTPDAIAMSPGASLKFTFVGTGLAIIGTCLGVTADNGDIEIDGVARGTLDTTGLVDTSILYRFEICSGLPYGTHTVKLARTTGGVLRAANFIVYQPRKPVFSGFEVADYAVLADFVASTLQNVYGHSLGVITKAVSRELIYSGTWVAIGLATNNPYGHNAPTLTSGAYLEYTFFGTAIECRFFDNATVTWAVTIDGVSDLSPYTTSKIGAGTFTASTGIVAGAFNVYGDAFSISDLPLGTHTIRMTKGGSDYGYILGFAVATPIYGATFKNGFNLPNSIEDKRKLSVATSEPNYVQAVGVTSAPSTSSTSFVPLPDMTCIFKSGGGPAEISFSGNGYCNTAGNYMRLMTYINGVALPASDIFQYSTVSGPYQSSISFSTIVNLGAGTHVIQMFWNTSAGTGNFSGVGRNLTVKEL